MLGGVVDPEKTPYVRLGGEAAVRKLVTRFYELMDTLPEARRIRAMHPDDLSGSTEKLFMFLSGWLGGPQLYQEAYGHPRLRARHLPFPVDEAARDAWMRCMTRAIEEMDIEDELLKQHLLHSLFKTADFMRNQPE
ncbi:MAG: globin [Gammaproteobacteria bacterium]|nr:globin [Gammaproteobacteria bacterium]